MFRLFTPHYRIHHVWELTPERLRQWGLCALLLDVDCTLSRYRQREALPEVIVWIEQLRTAGVRLCLVSNGMGARIEQFAERLDVPCVAKAMKPLPWGLQSAIEKLESPAFADGHRGRSGVRRRDGRPAGRHPQHPGRADPSRGRAMVHAAEASARTRRVGSNGVNGRTSPGSHAPRGNPLVSTLRVVRGKV